jgi:ABC-type transporter lipoprotein component MlaA
MKILSKLLGTGREAYAVLQVFRSSSVRDLFGLIIDTLFNPLHYTNDSVRRLSFLSMRQLDFRPSILAFYESISGGWVYLLP